MQRQARRQIQDSAEAAPLTRQAALPLGPLPSATPPASAGASLPTQHADDAPESDARAWYRRLMDGFGSGDPGTKFLPLAEEAIRACPGDADILLLAANAALIDGAHERALVFLKRFGKRAESPVEPLLHALALNLAGKRSAARQILERHRLTEWPDAFACFHAGRPQLVWLIAQVREIMTPDRPVRSRPIARPVSRQQKAARPRDRARGELAANKNARAGDESPAPLPLVDIEIPLRLEIDLAALTTAIARTPETDGRAFRQRERFARLGLVQGFDELLCLPHLVGVEPHWHQIETVRKVLKQFRGRVLLADEVGLGKTIEAGMVLKEYALRGMAERVLVLTPASLVGQWQEELERKFGLAFATTYDSLLREDAARFWDQPRIIASIATARRREHMEALATRQLDLVVVDEAHHLRDRTSAGWKLVDALNKRFLLLLTATPVQNDLIELYNLLTLLKPGIFKTLKEFRAAYMTPGKPRQPANPDSLRQLMRDAMVRNTRAAVALKLPQIGRAHV